MRLFPSVIEPLELVDDQFDAKKATIMMSNTVRLSIQPIAVKVFSLEANCFVDFEGGGRYTSPTTPEQQQQQQQQPLLTTGDGQLRVARTYTEGIRVAGDGPSRHCRIKSYLHYGAERHFKETVFFESRLVPHNYVTTVIVTEEMTGSAAPTPQLQYFEQICFKNKTVIVRRAETVYNFPREPQRRHVAKTTFHHNRKERSYVSGVLVSAPGNVLLLELPLPDATANGDTNGYGHADAAASSSSSSAADIRNDADVDSKTVYSSVKELVIE